MIQSILSNLAVILLSHLAITTLIGYRERFSKLLLQISIVLLMSITVISMFYLPIVVDNFRFDLRLIPLMTLAIFSGWRITLSTLFIACLWRLFMGGVGAIPGVLYGMALPTVFALLYARIIGRKGRLWDRFVIVSICWAISDIPLMFFLTDGFSILKQIGPWRYSSFLTATMIYYTVIQIEKNRFAMKERLEFLATHDQLTELLNRQECIRLTEVKAKSTSKNVKHFIAMFDIDNFKSLNDRYGHVAGDETLIQMAQIFKSFETDQVNIARYGGEEFMMHICAQNREEAITLLESIQECIRQTAFRVTQNQTISVTVSIGLAHWEENSSLQDTIMEADQKLYVAKDRGRDQMVV
ncbi:diguanylate cyclase [Sporosarcina sp. GW1-11]|uniref:GGDEF domain-containing protein n=1 Tax=Sporosarcina sp. GW1-11 TaxID=2899126 RepID=UPI00294E6717|nr:diguanylate cyclase [Sporosarcina sp. GW1-11]MDV6377467.1 diguanylate cyclase [Sporosarcina sp. GW1-11]